MIVVTEEGTITLGATETTPTIGIIDYSRRVTDDFGVTTVVKRGFARRMSVRFALPFEDVDSVQRSLATLRATPAQWVADDRFAWLGITGFYKDFSLDLAVPPLSFCTLTIEGLAETEPGADPGGDPAPAGAPSTLRMLRPVEVTDAELSASDVPENDYPEWAAGTTYALGARVIKAATHRIYESAAADNIGNDPVGATGAWIDVGPTNRWAMFDQALGTATARAGGISLLLAPGAVSALALLDVTGTAVRVQAAGYDRTMPVGEGAMTFLDLPGADDDIIVTITGPGVVSVGTLLVGDMLDLGITGDSPTAGIQDYSRKEVDDFGEVTVVPRSWSKTASARALIRTDALDTVANRIAAVRAQPVLWIGDEGTDTLTIYGFFKDFSIEVGEIVSTLSLSIEGLSEAAPLGTGFPAPGWPDIVDSDPENHPKPEDGATDGATAGDNLADSEGNILGDEDIITSLGVSADTAALAGVPSAVVIDALADAQSDIEAAEIALASLSAELDTEVGRLDGRADAANTAIDVARARLLLESEKLKAMMGMARVGLLAEVQERITAVSVQIIRIDGILATLDDPDDGLDAAHALIASLETATVSLDNPESLASKIDVLEAALDTAEGSLTARVETLETATASLAGDLAAAEGALDDNADSILALAGRTDTIEAGLDAQGEAIGDAQAALTTVEQALVGEHSGAVYRAERMAAQAGLARVGVLAEVRVRTTDVQAAYDAISVVDLKIETPVTGLRAGLVAAQSAIVDLDTNKAEASDLSALTVTVTDQGDRLTTAEGAIASQDVAIAGLVSDVDTIDSSLALIADDLGDLDGRLSTAEGTVATLVGTTSSLTARMTDAEDATDALDGRVTDAEAGIIAVQQAGVTDRAAAAYVAERMSAEVGLSRVSVLAERKVSATDTAAAVTRLDAMEATISTPTTGLAARVTGAEAAIVDLDANKAEVSTVEAIEAAIDTPTTGIAARIGSAETAITDLEGGKAEASALSALEAEIDDAETGLSSKASVIDLSTAVAGLDDDISTVAADVSTVSTAVDDLEAEVTTQATSIDGLSVRYSIRLNVNGHVSGVVQNNDGTQSDFIVQADKWLFAMPGVTPRVIFGADANGVLINGDLYVNNGKIITDTGTHMEVSGKGFGSTNQFLRWYGPKMALNLCSEANGLFWIKATGDAYFGGSLSAGILKNAIQTSDLASNASVICGPFGSNGGSIICAVSWTYTETVSATYSGDMDGIAAWNTDVGNFSDGNPSAPSLETIRTVSRANSTLTLARKIGAGAFADVQNASVTAQTQSFQGTRPQNAGSQGDATITLTTVLGFTYTDNAASTSDREFRATIARGSIGYGSSPATGWSGSVTSSQRISIVTTEE